MVHPPRGGVVGSGTRPIRPVFTIGTNIYLDASQTQLPVNSVGVIQTAPFRIAWTDPTGQHHVWTAAVTPTAGAATLEVHNAPSDALLPSTSHTIDFLNVLPTITATTFTTPDFLQGTSGSQLQVTLENGTDAGGDLILADGSSLGTYAINSLGRGQIRLSGPRVPQGDIIAVSPSHQVKVSFVFPGDFQSSNPGSLNGILNNEHGTSEEVSATSDPAAFTVGELDHQDEAAYLRMTPRPNSTLSCMTGARDIVRRIPLSAPFPSQSHSELYAHDYDFLNSSRMPLRRLKFQLCLADGTILPPRGHTSFSILFVTIEPSLE